jgi:hypothetical protein
MKLHATIAQIVLVLVMAERASAERAKGASGGFEGTIVRIAGNTFGVNTASEGKPQDVVNFRVGKDTSFSNGDKEATLKDLAVGMRVKVKAGNGMAKSVELLQGGDSGKEKRHLDKKKGEEKKGDEKKPDDKDK